MHMVSHEDMRSDIHPLAVLDTEDPMIECVCGLPVPMEMAGRIYCCQACEDKAFEDALIDNAIAEDKAKDASFIAEAKAKNDIFGQMFPQVAMMPEPELFPFVPFVCSCC